MVSYCRTQIKMVAVSNNIALKAFAAKALNSACLKYVLKSKVITYDMLWLTTIFSDLKTDNLRYIVTDITIFSDLKTDNIQYIVTDQRQCLVEMLSHLKIKLYENP